MRPESSEATPSASTSDAQISAGGKRAWITPAVDEVPFTRTEAGGAGAVYDFTVYAGSR